MTPEQFAQQQAIAAWMLRRQQIREAQAAQIAAQVAAERAAQAARARSQQTPTPAILRDGKSPMRFGR